MADNLLDKASILLTPTAYNDGSMLSVKPENGDGDFTFSRGSAATRVNAQGLVENVQIISSELVSNGDFSQGEQDWTFGTGWSVDQANSKAVHDSSAGATAIQSTSVSVVVGKKYELKYTASNLSGGYIRAEMGGLTPEFNFSDGTYTYNFTATTNANLYITASANVEVTNVSVKEITDDTDLPRIDYTDGCGVWLLEPQSTNLYLNSETLATQSNATSASTYTVSFYGTGTITFSGTHTGTLVGTGANDRVSVTFTTTSGTLTSTISGTCTKGQLENLSYATSYIPTEGATNTRLQDIANNSGNSTLINSTEGVLYGEIASLSNETSSNYISLSDGTYDNRLSIFYTSGSNIIRAFLRVGGASQADMTFTVSDITEFHKVAFKYKENDFALWINGVEVATDTSGSTIPSGTLTKLSFSEINTTGGLFRGKSKALAVYKEALTDAQLQSLTTI